ncbi:hypothetical protein SEA_GRASSBOY_66 [Microbacterium phage Grassboy]|nr:hypothetical protein SEA_GRASSBOY_66 [Microbacterium phage Grassboy]
MSISRKTIASLVALPVETVNVLLEAGWTLQLSSKAPARFEQPLGADGPRITPAIEAGGIVVDNLGRDPREVAHDVLESMGLVHGDGRR